jgi:hypothetical protein
MLEGARSVAEVGRGTQQITVSLEHVGGGHRQRRPTITCTPSISGAVAPDTTASNISCICGDGVMDDEQTLHERSPSTGPMNPINTIRNMLATHRITARKRSLAPMKANLVAVTDWAPDGRPEHPPERGSTDKVKDL